MATEQKTVFSVRPFTIIDIAHETDGATLEALATALDADPRAIAPVCGYDLDRHQLDALFQVEDDANVGLDRELATAGAFEIFDAALARAGIDAHTVGLAIVEGDDPDLLP